jgi:type VI secretion system protein ImpG
VHTRLASLTNASSFALFATPAVNLFEKQTDRVPLKTNDYEHIVMADRSHPIDYEIHRILDVQSHPDGAAAKLPVLALYAEGADSRATDSGIRYTVRRMPRLRTARERQIGLTADYLGSETYLSLSSTETVGGAKVQELSIRALCSNRHLPEHLPVGQGGADFRLVSDATLAIEAHFGPTRPRDAIAYALHDKRESETRGAIAWRLINMLALNQRGIALRSEDPGAGLREVLGLFANPADVSSDRRVKSVRSVTTRPAVRRLSERIGVGVARGLAIAVTVDEKAFEGSGAFLLGSVLDRFLSEYATMNQFTQLTLHGLDRGQIASFPPRLGARRLL